MAETTLELYFKGAGHCSFGQVKACVISQRREVVAVHNDLYAPSIMTEYTWARHPLHKAHLNESVGEAGFPDGACISRSIHATIQPCDDVFWQAQFRREFDIQAARRHAINVGFSYVNK